MRNLRALTTALSLFGATTVFGQQQTACDAPELVGVAHYDQLVCSGMRSYDAGRYLDAAGAFEAALRVNLLDIPNVHLLPRLALAYWHSGNRAAARDALAKARVAMMLVAGLYRCSAEAQAGGIVDGVGEAVTALEAREMYARMCGAAYETWYQRTTLQGFVRDAELVKLFLEAERVVR